MFQKFSQNSSKFKAIDLRMRPNGEMRGGAKRISDKTDAVATAGRIAGRPTVKPPRIHICTKNNTTQYNL